MKVAVLITGQMRDYKINCVNHLKHIIEPNNADVFVYACSKNTLHTTGNNITQNYKVTTTNTKQEIESEVIEIYGDYLRGVIIDEGEELSDDNFGTLGYFKKRMNNQMQNIRNGFLMAQQYSEDNNFEYDLIVRCRPDNSMFLRKVDLSEFPVEDGQVFTTIYPSGHKDPWFFSFSKPKTFDKYCSFIYQKDADESRTDNNFECPELALERYLNGEGMTVYFVQSICLPFYQYDKTQPVTEFPFRVLDAKLIDSDGNLVEQTV
tara:strand:+ start:1177 stop:1965 length:789 start_codon:yes stop_codon:yes gene_type:complete